MLCSNRLERVPHGSDLRPRSQDGKSRKEEAPELLANQTVNWWLGTGGPSGLFCLEGDKSALSSPVILMAVGAQCQDPH